MSHDHIHHEQSLPPDISQTSNPVENPEQAPDAYTRSIPSEPNENTPSATDAFEHEYVEANDHPYPHEQRNLMALDIDILSENTKETNAMEASAHLSLTNWGEEITSIVFGFICMMLALTVLICMDDKPLAVWKLSVQPTTAIAFLSTITRAALIFPLSECIGHLKWEFFDQPRSLYFMQIFDAASRGPLGAFNFLWRARLGSPVTAVAASVMILSLLLQPFMQQTIVISTRNIPVLNETASVTRATRWSYDDHEGPQKRCK
jgi:hypothetical protein